MLCVCNFVPFTNLLIFFLKYGTLLLDPKSVCGRYLIQDIFMIKKLATFFSLTDVFIAAKLIPKDNPYFSIQFITHTCLSTYMNFLTLKITYVISRNLQSMGWERVTFFKQMGVKVKIGLNIILPRRKINNPALGKISKLVSPSNY